MIVDVYIVFGEHGAEIADALERAFDAVPPDAMPALRVAVSNAIVSAYQRGGESALEDARRIAEVHTTARVIGAMLEAGVSIQVDQLQHVGRALGIVMVAAPATPTPITGPGPEEVN